MSSAREAPRRRRRTAAEARLAILEAAQKRLAEWGPEEIRLQDIASDLGISHPAILHHFGSRDALMLAVSRHAFDALNADLVASLERTAQGGDPAAWLDPVFETLRDRGHARLLAWSLLTGRLGAGSGRGAAAGQGATAGQGAAAGKEADESEEGRHMLLDLATAVHTRRVANAKAAGVAPPALEESVFAMQLVAAALMGDALMGPVFRRSAGLAGDEGAEERYREWLARRVNELLVPREKT